MEMSGRTTVRAWTRTLFAALALACGECGVARAQSAQTPDRAPAEEPAQAISASHAEAELQAGIALTRKGRFAEALPHFLAARGHVADAYAVEFNLALCYVGVREFQKAIPILIQLRDGHDDAKVENLLSQAYAGNDEPKAAFEAFQRAARFTPKDERLYLLVAAAFLEKEDYRQGLRVVQSGLRNLPDSARLHYESGYALWQLDESGLAKQEFERATSLEQHSEIAYLAAAQKSYMLGDLSQAAQIARAGIREGFSDYQLFALLGDALIRDGASPGQPEFSEAKKALEKSILVRPNYASSQISLGRLLLEEGRVDAAIEHLELGRQLAPQNPSPYMLLANAYRKRGRLEQARAMLAMVAKLNEEQALKRRLAIDEDR
jgi:tetratricopeptide (TPR) repeat protein